MAAKIQQNQQVVVKQQHLHLNGAEVKTGSVISISGESASVQLLGEDKPKTFPLSQLTPASDVFGSNVNLDNRREMPIKKMYPTHRQ